MGYLLHLFCFVFLDVLGFSIILPLLPYYVAEFKASPSYVGILLTSNAISQLITAPYLGKLSDTYGRRPILLLCVFGTCISFVVLYFSSSVEMILFSRILDGLLGGNISLAQAYITDLTEEKDRSKGFGVLGSAFGLAFIVGPATGAIVLSKYESTKIPSMIAAVLSFINLISIYYHLPESRRITEKENNTKENNTKESKTKENKTNIFQSWYKFHYPLDNISPKLFMFYSLRFSYGVIFSLFETTIGLYTSSVLNLSASSSNLFFVFVGVFFSGVQGYVRRLSIANELALIQQAFLVVSISITAMAFCKTSFALLAVLLPFSLATGLINTLLGSNITKTALKDQQGAALGLSSSIGSLTRIISPILGGYLFEKIGPSAPGILGGIVALFMVVCIQHGRKIFPVKQC